ncbi:T9SS type A sorting domain-containing protein [Bacteroidota bacterium]
MMLKYETVTCPDSLNCLASSTWGIVYQERNVFMKTIDGGNTWFNVFMDKGYAVYDEDSVWQYWKFPPTVRSIDCPTNNLCIAVHDSGYVSRTTDGGYTWNRNAITNIALREIDMYDSLNGIVSNVAAGAFLTKDGGVTWNKVEFPDSMNTTGIWLQSYTDSNTIILSTYPKDGRNCIIRSEDRGKTWVKRQTTTEITSFMGMKFVNKQKGWTVGRRKTGETGGQSIYNDCIYYTSNGGDTWGISLDSMTYPSGLTVIDAFDENHIMASGPHSQVWMSVDGGKNWHRQNDLHDMGKYGGIIDLAFISKTSAIALNSWEDEIYKYTEGPVDVNDRTNIIFDSDFNIFPNPATDYIHINSSPKELFTNIEIFSTLGVKMIEAINSDEIDVSELPSGIYFLKHKSQFYKFVKL